MSFHASPLTSDRIQRVLTALREYRDGLTTMQLNEICGSTRAASDVSELRANGIAVDCEYVGLSDNGRRVHRYRLADPAFNGEVRAA